MKVRDLVNFLQSLDQDKNIFLICDFDILQPQVDILSESDLSDLKFSDYLSMSLSDDELPQAGDYFFDAY